jgi:hypothetical protein
MVYRYVARLPTDEYFGVSLSQTQDPQSYLAQLRRYQQLASETAEATLTAAQEHQRHGEAAPYQYKQGYAVYVFNSKRGRHWKLRKSVDRSFQGFGRSRSDRPYHTTSERGTTAVCSL